MPSLMCRVCGAPKIPGQNCDPCYAAGRIKYRQVITNEQTQLKLAAKRSVILQRARDASRKRNRKRKGQPCSETKKNHKIRGKWLDLTLEALSRVLACFHRERDAQWYVWEGELATLRELLDEIEVVIPYIQKLLDRQRSSHRGKKIENQDTSD